MGLKAQTSMAGRWASRLTHRRNVVVVVAVVVAAVVVIVIIAVVIVPAKAATVAKVAVVEISSEISASSAPKTATSWGTEAPSSR